MRGLALKLVALAATLGGPLFLFDALAPSLGSKPAFLIAYAPVALLVLGAFGLGDEGKDRLARLFVRAGLVGAGLLLLVNAWTAVQLLVLHAPHPNKGLIAIGMLAGVPTSLAYAVAASRLLRRRPPRALVR